MKNIHENHEKFCKNSKFDYKAISLDKDRNLVIKKLQTENTKNVPAPKTSLEETRVVKFPKVFDESISTQKIYQDVLDDRVEKCFNGLSFTLLTYGISGSGKTHTTFGSCKQDGNWEDGLLFYTAKKIFKCRDAI